MARLLKGFTDLLQPINLLPDILAGGGGYPLSGSVTIPNTTSNVHISKLVTLSSSWSSVGNINYSFSNRELTLEFTFADTYAHSCFLMIDYNDVPLTLLTSTFSIKLNDSSTKRDVVASATYSSGATYYNKSERLTSAYNQITRIYNLTGGSHHNTIAITFPNGYISGEKVSVTIKDWAAYEGAFTNPPFCKSIAQLNNEGYMNNLLYGSNTVIAIGNRALYYHNFGTSLDSNVWNELFKIELCESTVVSGLCFEHFRVYGRVISNSNTCNTVNFIADFFASGGTSSNPNEISAVMSEPQITVVKGSYSHPGNISLRVQVLDSVKGILQVDFKVSAAINFSRVYVRLQHINSNYGMALATPKYTA